MNELVEKYVKLGILKDKIITTKQQSIVLWSLSKKCIIDDDDIENCKSVSMLFRTDLTQSDIDEINNSNGIICTDQLNGREGYRYGFVPV